MNNFPIIQLKKVCKSYQINAWKEEKTQGRVKNKEEGEKSSFSALKKIDLTIYQGEYISIMGPSGSGKSTLMYILGCLSTPTSGSYFLSGREVSQLKQNELAKIRNKQIGFVFQNFNLLPQVNLIDNVALPLVYRGIKKKVRRQQAKESLIKLGLEYHLTHKPNELSGGQQQRVSIARALVTQPDVILADEPTGNLDTRSGEEVISLLEDLFYNGRTIILVTHNLAIAQRTQRMISLIDGKIEEKQDKEISYDDRDSKLLI